MNILSDLKMYSRFAWGLRGFLHHTISLEEAKVIIQQRMADREKNFLHLIELGIFGYPKSPYLPLMKLAACELGDIQNLVRTRGLENTLQALKEAGVYITFEEFKGRQPIERHGQVIPVQAHDFDNPYLRHYYEGESSGSTGAGTRVAMDLDHIVAQTPRMMLAYDAHGIFKVPTAFWYGTLPDHTGINNMLRSVLSGNIAKKWFSPITKQNYRAPLKNRLATQYMIAMARLHRMPIPWPEPVPLDQAVVIARWVARTLETDGPCLIRSHVSMAVRVCIAAREERLDLTGATFMGGGEPPTPAKVREITLTGARWIPTYFFTEAGAIGVGCAQPKDGNDLHFLKDALALIQSPHLSDDSETTAGAFYFTTLLPAAPKLMLNVESDDHGVIESRSCGCPLESYGFTEHLHNVRSFRKLTSGGVTLVGSEMIRILEEVLPAQFGGSPLDYQLLEEEDGEGFTRLNLLVNPKIKIENEKEVIEVVLDALRESSVSAALARAIWSQTKTLQVKRMEPIWTGRGKLMPLRVARRSGGSSVSSQGPKSASRGLTRPKD